MNCHSKKSVFEQPCSLFCSLQVVPQAQDSPGQKINALFRLVIAIALILYVMNNKHAITFLIIGVLVLFILHHMQNVKGKAKIVEGYHPDRQPPLSRVNEAPIIAPHSHDLDVWNPGAYVHSGINKEGVVDYSQLVPYGSESGNMPWIAEYQRPKPVVPCPPPPGALKAHHIPFQGEAKVMAPVHAEYKESPLHNLQQATVTPIGSVEEFTPISDLGRSTTFGPHEVTQNMKDYYGGIAESSSKNRRARFTEQFRGKEANDYEPHDGYLTELMSEESESEDEYDLYGEKKENSREYFTPIYKGKDMEEKKYIGVEMDGKTYYGTFTPNGSNREIFDETIQPTGRPQNAAPYNTPSIHEPPMSCRGYLKTHNPSVEAYKDWTEKPIYGSPVWSAHPRKGPACQDCNCIEPINANLGISNASLLASQLGSIPAYDHLPQIAGVEDYIAEDYFKTLGKHGSSLVGYGSGLTNETVFKLQPENFRVPPKIGTAQGDTIDKNALRYMPQRDPNIKFMSQPCTDCPYPRDGRWVGLADQPAYMDTQLGQIRYDYSEIDAYRQPNFIYRSVVDHLDYITPDGRRLPEYFRTPLETRAQAEHAFQTATLEFRQDLMERQMRKRNQELCQLRHAPLRSDSGMQRNPVAGGSPGGACR